MEDKSGSYRACIADNASQELTRKEAKERIAELTARVRAMRRRRR